ncbi:MAG: hypothetical protein U5J83_01615 [Bryobacterales bacterium]|nr:hypothetical protein [Bryobacterales bacterium]
MFISLNHQKGRPDITHFDVVLRLRRWEGSRTCYSQQKMSNPESSAAAHHRQSAAQGAIRLAVVTVSDTRTPETDKNGPWLKQQIEAGGHKLVDYRLVKE